MYLPYHYHHIKCLELLHYRLLCTIDLQSLAWASSVMQAFVLIWSLAEDTSLIACGFPSSVDMTMLNDRL